MRIFLAVAYIFVILFGLMYPLLGIAVFAFMGIMVIAGKKKKWCSSYCPRGSFLDIVMSRISPKKPAPKWLRKKWFKRGVLATFIALFTIQLHMAGLLGSWPQDSLIKLGTVFARMCIISSAVAIPLALWRNQRTWCSFCPVGNLLRKTS